MLGRERHIGHDVCWGGSGTLILMYVGVEGGTLIMMYVGVEGGTLVMMYVGAGAAHWS